MPERTQCLSENPGQRTVERPGRTAAAPAGPGRAPRRAPLLPSSVTQSLRALLLMAQEPGRWQSVPRLAAAEGLPEARLEQLLLKLRRAGLLEARRGRLGGYRLARSPAALPVAAILAALEAAPPRALLQAPPEPEPPLSEPGSTVPAQIPRQQIPAPEPAAFSEAGERVTAALEARLQRALERELAACTLEDLHHDLRSTRALLSEEGLLLG